MPAPGIFRLWHRFFFGVIIGALTSWLIFLYMFAEMQEKQTATIRRQANVIAELEKEKRIWQEDFKKLNEENKKLLTVQDIQVEIINGDQFRIDPLSLFEVEEAVKRDIHSVLAKDLQVVFQSRQLLKRAIENKPVRINDKRYKLVIKEMVFYTTLTIQLELELSE
jgi:hypothetical protein